MVAAPGIEVRGLHRAFGSVRAVDGLDLVATSGQVTGLVGPNGAGKTTLLLVLATLLAPDAGEVRVAGYDPVRQPHDVRRHMGWMPDGLGTWDTLTVTEVLRTVAAAYGIGRADAARRIDELLALLHLGHLADRPARVLSRGQKQRLGLARALIHDPQVLLLDEPAAGLDPRGRIELRDVLRALAQRGRTVLVSSHILTELQEMADRAVIVAAGRTVTTHDLRTQDRPGRWRITTLDEPGLEGALGRRGWDEQAVRRVPAPTWPATYEVEIGDHAAAAALLGELVRDGVAVSGLAPVDGGGLEAAYLAATAPETDSAARKDRP